MHASNHCDSIIPSLKDLLNTFFRGVHKISDRLYKKYGCHQSGPVDFPGFNEHNFPSPFREL